MGGNVKDAHTSWRRQARKKEREQERERLNRELENDMWGHLVLAAGEEKAQIWVKPKNSAFDEDYDPHEAVRRFSKDFMLKEWVTPLPPVARITELCSALNDLHFVDDIRDQMPEQ